METLKSRAKFLLYLLIPAQKQHPLGPVLLPSDSVAAYQQRLKHDTLSFVYVTCHAVLDCLNFHRNNQLKFNIFFNLNCFFNHFIYQCSYKQQKM